MGSEPQYSRRCQTIAEVTRREYYGSDRISLLSTIAEVTRRDYDGSALT
jgi:hypothetical protein